MANLITIKGSHDFNTFTMIQEKINERGAHNILVLTDSIKSKEHWESKGVRAELIKNINHDSIVDLEKRYKNVDTVIVTSVKMINTYLTETLNVKIINAKHLFEEFNSTVILISEYSNLATEVSYRDYSHKNTDYAIRTTRTRRSRALK